MMIIGRRKEERLPREVAKLPWVKDPAPIDESFGDVIPVRFGTELARGDWRAARYVVTELCGGDLDRAFVYRQLGLAPPVETARRWVRDYPEDGLGRLVLGTALVDHAWVGGQPSPHDAEARNRFRRILQEAEMELWQASDLLPGSAIPWDALVWSGIGLRIPVTELALRHDEGHRRQPFDGTLATTALQMLSSRWFGSTDQMFAYARAVTAEAPAGSAAHAVLPRAYLELVLDRRREVPIDEACQVLAADQALAELKRAAELSIHHRDFVQDAAGLRTANAFLVAFYEGGHDAEAARVLHLLRGRYCARPFDDFGDPGRMYRKAEIITARAVGEDPELIANGARETMLIEEPVFTWA